MPKTIEHTYTHIDSLFHPHNHNIIQPPRLGHLHMRTNFKLLEDVHGTVRVCSVLKSYLAIGTAHPSKSTTRAKNILGIRVGRDLNPKGFES